MLNRFAELNEIAEVYYPDFMEKRSSGKLRLKLIATNE